jgi:hypothetical protein
MLSTLAYLLLPNILRTQNALGTEVISLPRERAPAPEIKRPKKTPNRPRDLKGRTNQVRTALSARQYAVTHTGASSSSSAFCDGFFASAVGTVTV